MIFKTENMMQQNKIPNWVYDIVNSACDKFIAVSSLVSQVGASTK